MSESATPTLVEQNAVDDSCRGANGLAQRNRARQIIVVLGIHRSGTSLCMNILNQLGVCISHDLLAGDLSNEGGYFESREILALNEGILQTIHASWHTIFSAALPENWHASPALTPWKDRLASLLRRQVESSAGVWAMKDPRLCPLLPFYEDVLEECGLEPAYVVCIRDPRAVALSLKRRDNIPQMLAELLWIDYTMSAIRIGSRRRQVVIHYEQWFDGGARQVRTLLDTLRLRTIAEASSVVERTVSRALNHGRLDSFCLTSTGVIYGHIQNGEYAAALAEYRELLRSVHLGIRASLSCRQVEPEVLPGAYCRTICQLFWRSAGGDGFNENDSSRQSTDLGDSSRQIRLPIRPAAQPIEALRLDPVSSAGYAHLSSLRLLGSDGGNLWEWDCQRESLAQCESYNLAVLERSEMGPGVILHFETFDPGMLLPISEELGRLIMRGGTVEYELTWLGQQPPATPKLKNCGRLPICSERLSELLVESVSEPLANRQA